MNLESSRSHSIATVYCETGGGDTGQIPCYGKVSFVDLAGSERVKDTKTAGGMLKETSAINRSLFTLGKAGPPPTVSGPPRARKTVMIWPPVNPCSEQGRRLQQQEAGFGCSRHRCMSTHGDLSRAWAVPKSANEVG